MRTIELARAIYDATVIDCLEQVVRRLVGAHRREHLLLDINDIVAWSATPRRTRTRLLLMEILTIIAPAAGSLSYPYIAMLVNLLLVLTVLRFVAPLAAHVHGWYATALAYAIMAVAVFPGAAAGNAIPSSYLDDESAPWTGRILLALFGVWLACSHPGSATDPMTAWTIATMGAGLELGRRIGRAVRITRQSMSSR